MGWCLQSPPTPALQELSPVSVASLAMLGYFHMMTWFWLYPCVDTISFTFLLQLMLHTCLFCRSAAVHSGAERGGGYRHDCSRG